MQLLSGSTLQVSIPEVEGAPEVQEASEQWYMQLCTARSLTKEEQESMLAMCGTACLLKALQKLQFEHMLAHHSEMMAKLKAKLAELLPHTQV